MSIKKEFIEKVKIGFPNFNPETDKVFISYKGSDDSFDSFSDAIVKNNRGQRISGNWICDNDLDFLFQIIERSKVYYSWVDAKVSGSIRYANKRLWVENTQCEKIVGYNNYIDDDSYGYDNDVFDYDNTDEWNCTEERGAVLDSDEDLYDVYDLNEDGLDSYDKAEISKSQTPVLNATPVAVETVKTKKRKITKKPKPTQKKNGKKITKTVKKAKKNQVKAKKQIKPKKKAIKKKK